MKARYMNIGDNDWGVVLLYDYEYYDFDKLWSILRAFGLSDSRSQAALSVLSKPNTGMTVTSEEDMMSLVLISRSTSLEQWFDTLLHELKHLVEHIDNFYHLEPDSEPSAYLQGEIGRLMFPIIVSRICECVE